MATSPRGDSPLRIALTSYRSKPHSGGQGIYVRNLSRSLVALGHRVEVFSGPPYPELDDIPGVRFTRVPSLDLYREPDPFRVPKWQEFGTPTDVLEYAIMASAGFPEPRTFARRVVPLLAARAGEFDVVHDNQSFGRALLRLPQLGLPLVGTLHHPISVDRDVELAHLPLRQQLAKRRWYGFVRMQARVARRVPVSITPSRSSAEDAVRDFGINADRLVVVPVGVDTEQFAPSRHTGPRVPGRIVAMCSADVPIKGLRVLLRAMAALPSDVNASLTVVAKPVLGGPSEKLVAELGLAHRVTFVSGLSDDEVAELMASAELACVPSLYEGFSLPAVEAMASGTALIASAAGALPEVVGSDGSCGVLVPPGDVRALTEAITALRACPARRAAMGAAARARVEDRFSWQATARSTAEVYRRAIAEHARAEGTH